MNVQPTPQSETESMFGAVQQADDAQVEDFESSLALALSASAEAESPEETSDGRLIGELGNELRTESVEQDPNVESEARPGVERDATLLGRAPLLARVQDPSTSPTQRDASNAEASPAPPRAASHGQSSSAPAPSTADSLASTPTEQTATGSIGSRQIDTAVAASESTPRSTGSKQIEPTPAATESMAVAKSEPTESVEPARAVVQSAAAAGLAIGRLEEPRRLPSSNRSAEIRSVPGEFERASAQRTDTPPNNLENAAPHPAHEERYAQRLPDDIAFTAEAPTAKPESVAAPSSTPLNPALDHPTAGVQRTPLNIEGNLEMTRPQPVEALPNQIGLMASRGGGTARLRLHPGELGEVEITVSIRGEAVDIMIRAEEPAARAAVLHHRELLAEALGSRELRMEGFDVNSGGRNSESEERQAAWSGAEERNEARRPASTTRGHSAESRQAGIQQITRTPMTRSEGIDLRI